MALDKAVVERMRAGMAGAAKGGRLTEGQVEVARRALIGEALRSNPAGGRVAAVAEASVVLKGLVGKKRRVKVKVGGGAAKKRGPKQATKRPAETLQQKVDRLIQENLTAALGPKAVSGAGASPGPAGDGMYGALASQSREGSPFWRLPGDAPGTARAARGAGPAVASEAELAAMSPDEVRAYAAAAFRDAANAGGFRSPIWQGVASR